LGTSFGIIATHKTDLDILKKSCSELEENGYFENWVISCSPNNWNCIYDENLEWGNIDIYIQLLFDQSVSTVLSVEYYDDSQVRYKLWENCECIGVHSSDEESRSNKNISIFAKELGVKRTIISKIFAEQSAEKSLMLMESLLQCQLWMPESSNGTNRIIAAEYCTSEYLEKYLSEQKKQRAAFWKKNTYIYEINTVTAQSGTLENICSDYPFILDEENGEGIFYSIDRQGELNEAFRIPLDILAQRFSLKSYAGYGLFGFLNKQDIFVLYEGDRVLATFPDIGMPIKPWRQWYSYMPDKDTILMEWACYDVKSGKKKWDFPLPIREKTYKNHMRLEMWHELPTGFILTQVNVDDDTLYLSLIDLNGVAKKTVSLELSINFHRVDIEGDFIYAIIERAKTIILTVFDFELNALWEYQMPHGLISYVVYFDSMREHFYYSYQEQLVRVHIKNRSEKKYEKMFKGVIAHWGMFVDDIIYLASDNGELILLDSLNNMECIFRYKIKNWILRLWPLSDGNLLMISQIPYESQLVLHKITKK